MRPRYMLVAGQLALALTLLQFAPLSHAAPGDSASPVHLVRHDRPDSHASVPNGPSPADMLTMKDPTGDNIATIVSDMLETYQYSLHPFDQEIASRFLDRYLDTLDYSHIYFLKSDLADFEPYRTNLQNLTLKLHDTSPCWKIFARFMDRATERLNFVTNLLTTEKFDFSANDRFVANRHTLPYAQDIAEAHNFWRQELRCEYLDQLITAPDIQFSGPLSFDDKGAATVVLHGNGSFPVPSEASFKPKKPSDGEHIVAVTTPKSSSATFDLLPGTFLAKDGHQIAWVDAAAGTSSNLTVHLNLESRDNLKKTTNSFYSPSGDLLGDISFHHPRTETNAAALEAVIHLNQKNVADIYKNLTNHYVQGLKNYKDLDRDRVFEIYINSLARAYDPHSDYMGHSEAENFDIQMRLSLFGIGALLMQDGSYCKISELKEGPAAKSGKLKPGDRIIAVAQTNSESIDVVGLPLDKVVEMIRGPKGTQVTLTIIPSDAVDPSDHKEVTLIRDEIKLEDAAAKASLFEEPRGNGHPDLKLGVIDLPSFYAQGDSPEMATTDLASNPTDTTTDVSRLIKRLKKEHVNGIILDLRRNGGGYLEEAIKLTGLFVPRGPVVQTKDPDGNIQTDPCRNASVLYDGPLIILTSRFSASASEILAGALQDYNRALIVGDHSTFGKGTVQTMQGLAPLLQAKHLDFAYNPGSLKVTIKKFYRAAGVSTQLKGVVSDIELPSIWNYATDEVGESALPNALPCDEVPSADPVNLNRVTPYVEQLQQLSKRRVSSDHDFSYIQDDIAEYLKEQADKSISLNQAGRIQEQKTRTERAQARKKERAARAKSDDKVFEITLKNVDSPQLQLPLVKTNSVASVSAPEFNDDDAADAVSSQDSAALDPTLTEARHILADYVAMINKEPIISKVP